MDADTQLPSKPHLVFIPHLAQGHMIPMVDMARSFAKHGATITVVTTPANAARFTALIDHDAASGLSIQTHTVAFPGTEVGLPEGCETLEFMPTEGMLQKFMTALSMLRAPIELYLQELQPKPICIISGMGLPWASQLAHNLGIPNFVFHGFCCFALLCIHKIRQYKLKESVNSDWETFSIPGLEHEFKFNRAQVPLDPPGQNLELAADGVVVNTFDALEQHYVSEYQRAIGKKAWVIGPLSLCNTTTLDMVDRGNKSIVGEDMCRWLDSKDPKSVIYICFGSISDMKSTNLREIGLGLEASNYNFIWVVRLGKNSQEMEKWFEEFEKRVKGRGLVIKGWAPQVLVLSHPSIGAFFTHCGWNSTLEGICAGVPMATWPMFAEQFFNERMIVDVLQIGVSLGVKEATRWGKEEEVRGLIRREDVKKVLERVMDEGDAGEERRRRAKGLAEAARRAMEDDGSSNMNMDLFIQNAMSYAQKKTDEVSVIKAICVNLMLLFVLMQCAQWFM